MDHMESSDSDQLHNETLPRVNNSGITEELGLQKWDCRIYNVLSYKLRVSLNYRDSLYSIEPRKTDEQEYWLANIE